MIHWRRLLVAVLAAMLGLAWSHQNASAHAMLRSSNPSDGALLARSPSSISLTFTEQPELTLTEVRVLDASGSAWDQGSINPEANDPLSIQVPVKNLKRGPYTVTWRTVSRADGHATAGAFSFGVEVSPADAAPSQIQAPAIPPTSWLEVLGRFGTLIGLVALLGGALASAILFGGTPVAVRRFSGIGWAVSLAGLLLLGVAQRRAAGVGLNELLATSIGRALLWRMLAILVAATGLVVAWRAKEQGRATGYRLAALGAAGAVLAHVAAGHAAADASLRWLNVFSQSMHFLAVSVWVGGLAALYLGTRGAPGSEKSRAVKRFSTLAGVMLIVVAATGVFRAFNEIDSWSDLIGSNYGRLVLLKICLLIVLAGLGAVNRYRNVPRIAISLGGLRRTSRVELGVMALVLVAAAVLASVAPPSPHAAAGRPESLVVLGSDFATSVRARLEASPGYAGINTFTLRIADYDTGEPVRARRVTARFAFLDEAGIGVASVRLRSMGPGLYRAQSSNLSLDGRWRVTITLERGAESVDIPLRLATRCHAQAITDPGRATVHIAELLGGRTLQGYVEPGTPGPNTVHVTFFDRDGNETPVRSVRLSATRLDGHARKLRSQRLAPGHFIANSPLGAGNWRFDIEAGRGRVPLRACFEETIES